jgi:biopolymer transport protein ExbB/TolQ
VNKLNAWLSILFRSPIFWGGLLSALYYGGIESGVVRNPFLLRFTAGHFVEHVVTMVFFVGSAALVLKGLEVHAQRRVPAGSLLGPIPFGGQTVDDAARLAAELDRAPSNLQRGYLLRRLRDALDHIMRSGNADSLDTEIKYLSDLDAVRAQHGYALVRVIIWSIPIMGLLGTVIGITGAFANLVFRDGKLDDASLPQVLAGLKVAFDTTGMALSLCMALMFVQYFVDRLESQLLTEVDARTNTELKGRFQSSTLGTDPQLGPIRRMVEAVLKSNDRLVTRQVEIWRQSMDAAESKFGQLAASSGQQLESALAGALDQTLKAHAAAVAAAAQSHAAQNERHWGQVQQSLVQAAEAASRQQAELAKQAEILLKVVEATGQVTRLEDALNHNLAALGGSRNFEETLVALGAAVQLLSARLAQGTGDVRPIALAKPKRVEKAA